MNRHAKLVVASALHRTLNSVRVGNPDIGVPIEPELIGGFYTDLYTGRMVTWLPCEEKAFGRRRLGGYIGYGQRVAAIKGASLFFQSNMADTPRARAVAAAMKQNQAKLDEISAQFPTHD